MLNRIIRLVLCPAALALAGHAQADTPDSRWAAGDWGGERTRLLERGYDFSLRYTSEMASNLGGGYDQQVTARYADQFALGTHLDLQKILAWNDTEFQLLVTERSGRDLSNDRLSDPRTGQYSSVQEIWGRGQTWRLTELWISQGYFDDALNLKLGRYGVGDDFNYFSCAFQNLAFCGSQAGKWAGSVWYNLPVSQWALRAKYRFGENWFAQLGVFNENPSNLKVSNGLALNSSGTQGMLLPAELVWQPKVGDARLPGEYRVGYYYSTAKADDLYEDVDGQPQPLTGKAFKSRDSKDGWWLVAQQQVTARDGDASRGLTLFANLTLHDKATNKVRDYQQVGLTYKGPFDARPRDVLGLGVARIHTNDRLRERQRLSNAVSGVEDYDNPAYLPLQGSEYDAELFYALQLTRWLTVQPSVQFVRHPGGVEQVQNATVAGLRIAAEF